MTELAPGSRVGRYVIVRALARERASWLAYDPALRRRVRLELHPKDAEQQLALARALSRVHHAAVVAIHDVGDHEGVPFVAREQITGVPLVRALTERRRPAAALRAWLPQLARGLAEAHRAGVYHGALSSKSILVGPDDRVALIGFTRHDLESERNAAFAQADGLGLAGVLDDAIGETRRHHGRDLGLARIQRTLHAPELARGELAAFADAFTKESERGGRRRGFALFGSALAVIGCAAIGWRLADAGAPSCDDAGDRIDGVWDPEQSARVAAGFVATGSRIAADSSAAVDRSLDGWARRFNALRSASCLAARAGTLAAHELDRRSACLARRRAELDALVRVLLLPDAELVERATAGVRELHGPETCLAGDAGESADEAVEAALDDARALRIAGRYAQSIAISERARTLVHDDDDPRTRARIDLELGIARSRGGQGGQGQDDLVDAIADAWRAGADRLAVEAWTELAFTQSEQLGHHTEALQSSDVARAALVRAGDDAQLAARFHYVHGVVMYRLGRYEDSVAAHQLALARLAEREPTDELAMASSLNSMANAAQALGRYDEALADYRRAQQIYVDVLGPEHPDTAGVINNECAARYRSGQLEAALSECDRAYRIRAKALGDEHPVTLASLDNLGAITSDLGRKDEALDIIMRALHGRERVLGLDHPDVSISLVNAANILLERGRVEEATRFFERAVAIDLRYLGDRHPETAVTVQNLGRAHYVAGRWRESLASYEQALQIRERAATTLPYVIARNRLQIAEALLELARIDEAAVQIEAAAALASGPDIPQFVRDHLAMVRAELQWWRGDRSAAISALEHLLGTDVDREVGIGIRAWLKSHAQPTGVVDG